MNLETGDGKMKVEGATNSAPQKFVNDAAEWLQNFGAFLAKGESLSYRGEEYRAILVKAVAGLWREILVLAPEGFEPRNETEQSLCYIRRAILECRYLLVKNAPLAEIASRLARKSYGYVKSNSSLAI